MPSLRLGAVPYLNAKPLVHALTARPEVALSLAPPSAIGAKLRAGALDLGLIPAFEAAAHPGYCAVDGVAIASDGPVRSVLLYCRRAPATLRNLAPDPASQSSNALAKVLLAEQHGLAPEPLPEELPDKADAVLAIGDRALKGLDGTWETVLDLGEAWKRLTDLPFVYALWAGRKGAVPPGAADLLREAKRQGLENLESIARNAAASAGLSSEQALDYLKNAIRYDLGVREKQGLNTFLSLAKTHGLLARVFEPEWI